MKHLISLFVIIGGLLLCQSCGITTTSANSAKNTFTSVEYKINSNNYRVLGCATGESHEEYVLGFGGLSQRAVEETAIRNMYKQANLSGSQALVDVYVEKKVAMALFFYVKVTYIARGTIIEYIK